MADLYYHVPQSSYMLSCLHSISRTNLHLGARAEVLNPYFQYFTTPDSRDSS